MAEGKVAPDQDAVTAIDQEGTTSPSQETHQKDPRLARTKHLPVRVGVVLGSQQLAVKSLLNWGIGTQIVLHTPWHSPVAVTINGLPVGSGRVVLVGNNFGVEVTEWGRK